MHSRLIRWIKINYTLYVHDISQQCISILAAITGIMSIIVKWPLKTSQLDKLHTFHTDNMQWLSCYATKTEDLIQLLYRVNLAASGQKWMTFGMTVLSQLNAANLHV